MLKKSFLLASVLSSSVVFATPTPIEVKSVIQHYHSGETPILYDFKLCAEIEQSGMTKNDCKIELDPENVTVATKAYVWMAYLVPKGLKSAIFIQSNFKGMTMQAQSVSVAESLRYRTWLSVNLNKVGTWELPVLLENADGFTELNKLTVNVIAKEVMSAEPKEAIK